MNRFKRFLSKVLAFVMLAGVMGSADYNLFEVRSATTIDATQANQVYKVTFKAAADPSSTSGTHVLTPTSLTTSSSTTATAMFATLTSSIDVVRTNTSIDFQGQNGAGKTSKQTITTGAPSSYTDFAMQFGGSGGIDNATRRRLVSTPIEGPVRIVVGLFTGSTGRTMSLYTSKTGTTAVATATPSSTKTYQTIDYTYEGADEVSFMLAPGSDMYVTEITLYKITAPTVKNLQATPGNQEVALSWDAVSGAEKYIVYQDDVKIGESTTNGYTAIGLNNNQKYTFSVTAVTNALESEKMEIEAIPYDPDAAPVAPKNLKAAVEKDGIALSWDESGGATGYKGYIVNKTDGGEQEFTTADIEIKLTDGFINGKNYNFEIYASNDKGLSAGCAELSSNLELTLPQPATLTATPTNSEISLSWNTVALATGYNIYQDGNKINGSDPLTTTSYSVTSGINNGASYKFEVEAVNFAGASVEVKPHADITYTKSNPVIYLDSTGNITVSNPNYNLYLEYDRQNLDVTATLNGVEVSGGLEVNDNEGTYFSRKTLGLQEGLNTITVVAKDNPDSDLTAEAVINVTYFFSADSNIKFDKNVSTIVKGSTVNVTAEISNHENVARDVLLSAAVYDENDRLVSLVQQKDPVSGNTQDQKVTTSIVVPDTIGEFTLKSFFWDDKLRPLIGAEDASMSVGDEPPLAAPTDLTAQGIIGGVQLSWNASDRATAYDIYMSTDNSEYPIKEADVTPLTATITGLTAGTRYYFKIKAKSTTEESDFSTIASAIPRDAASGFIQADGWYETAYAEWEPAASSYEVQYKLATDDDELYQTADTELVRHYVSEGKYRVDIPGLLGDEPYTIKVVPDSGDSFQTTVTTMKYDRSGYAHFNYNNEGIGAYNNDGTPKDNAVIVYVTQENKNTVTIPSYEQYTDETLLTRDGYNVKEGYIKNSDITGDTTDTSNKRGPGIGNILNGNQSLMGAITSERPLIIRIIGTVNGSEKDGTGDGAAELGNDISGNPIVPTHLNGLTPWAVDGVEGKDSPGGNDEDNGYMAIIRNAKNVTVEGIGYDARIFGWGIAFSHSTSAANANGGKNYEVRNLIFQDSPEDAVSVETPNNASKIQRAWIHNNTFYSGYCATPAKGETDKLYGDGSCDFKRGEYFTMSYNHFSNTRKTGLIGGGDSHPQYHVTLHHNWWENSYSRTPLARMANIHMYNNYISKTAGQKENDGADLRANAYALCEGNYYANVKNVFVSSGTGSRVKSFNDAFYHSVPKSGANYTIVDERTTPVTNDNIYPNFDTDSSIFYYDSEKQESKVERLTDAVTAKAEAIAYSGNMKKNPVTPVKEKLVEDPANAVSVPYSITYSSVSGVNISKNTTSTWENIVYAPISDFKGTTVLSIKEKGVVFKLASAAKVTLKDGGASYQSALYNQYGVLYATLASGGEVSVTVPAGVYFIETLVNDMSRKESKLASLSIDPQ